MDHPDDGEVGFDFSPFLIRYKSGRVCRLMGTSRVPAALLARAERSWGFVCAGKFDLDHPFINPLAMPAAEWAALGCRRALVTVAELDTLSDRGRRYVEALRASGWHGEEAVLYETPGEGHVYFIDKSGGGGDKAVKEMAAVVSFINKRQS